jgi:hypothetical protein
LGCGLRCEPGIVKLLGQLQCDVEIILNMPVSERGIAADEQNFHCPVLQRLIDLPTPSVSGLKRQDVGEHAEPFGLKLGREPKRKFVVDRRRLDQKDRVSHRFCSGCGGARDCRRRHKIGEHGRDRSWFRKGLSDSFRDNCLQNRRVLRPKLLMGFPGVCSDGPMISANTVLFFGVSGADVTRM